MPLIKEIIKKIDDVIPPSLCSEWDNSGLQVGNTENSANNVMASVDITQETAEKALKKKCSLILSHHPILFKDTKKIDVSEEKGSLIEYIIKNDLTVYSIHTNLDKAEQGFNAVFKKWFDFIDTKPVQPEKLAKLVTFVPEEYTERVLSALWQEGAGVIGDYNKTSFRTTGMGTFEATEKTSPAVGKKGFNEIPEERLEICFELAEANNIIDALKKVHPYEEPAYDIYEIRNTSESGIGVIGRLKQGSSLRKIINKVKEDLNLSDVAYKGDLNQKIQTIAIIPGSGGSYATKADLLITGDVKHHDYRDSESSIIDTGHFEIESYAMNNFCAKLGLILKKQLKVNLYYDKGKPARKYFK